MEKRTKIVATISDRNCEPEFLSSLYEAGMNAVRINSAHASFEGAARIVENVRKVSDQIAIIIDTKGPEIRITGMAEGYAGGIPVQTGQTVGVKGTDSDQPSAPEMIYVNHAAVYNDVPVGARVLIDDGELELEVVGKEDEVLLCRVNNGGLIKARKSVNIPGVAIDLPTVSEKDRQFILWGIENDVDFIAHSFVRSREDILEVKKILEEHDSPIKVISKIENHEGVRNIDEILVETYGIMVARGDLGVEMAAEEIPVVQTYIVRKCVESKTPVIIATQMLHSMINNPRPTRAEVSDIAGAIYQHVDAIMLSGETASGAYPVEAVTTMAKVAHRIELDSANYSPDVEMNMVHINNEVTAQLSRSAVRATLNLPVKAIVIDTTTGRTARYLSAFRGQKPVYAVCYHKSVMRQLAISFGIHAIYREAEESHNSFLISILYYLESRKWLNKEDMIVVVGGSFGSVNGASFMEIGQVVNLLRKATEKQVTCNKG